MCALIMGLGDGIMICPTGTCPKGVSRNILSLPACGRLSDSPTSHFQMEASV